MLCPNCTESLQTVILNNQVVLHCSNCGGSFFEENAINRINAHDARTLSQNRKSDIVMGTPKICPHDNIFLHLIEHNEAVPQNVTLFKCPKCNGVFAYHDELIKFKKAQDVKISFFKIWENPLPSLKAVLLLSFIAVLSLTVFSNLKNPNLPTTKAEDIVQNVNFSLSEGYLVINFKTSSPVTSSIVIEDQTLGIKTTKDISPALSVLHYTVIKEVNPQDQLYYQLVLKDKKGVETVTEKKRIIVQ
jgi:Zn-finger nucleic acid-binding protein